MHKHAFTDKCALTCTSTFTRSQTLVHSPAHTHAVTDTCALTYTHTRSQTLVHSHAHTRTRSQTLVHSPAHTYVHSHLCTHLHTHTFTATCALTCTHTHVHSQLSTLPCSSFTHNVTVSSEIHHIFSVDTQTDIHPFNDLFSTTTWVRWHQKGENNLDYNEARDDGVAVASAGTYAHHLHVAADR